MAETSPTDEPADSAAASDLGYLLALLWRRRFLLVTALLVGGLLAAGWRLLKPCAYATEVRIAVGFAPPFGALRDPKVLANTLCSSRWVLGAVDDSTAERLRGDADFSTFGEIVSGTDLVRFVVTGRDQALTERVVRAATERIIKEDKARFQQVQAWNESRADRYEMFARRIEAALDEVRGGQRTSASKAEVDAGSEFVDAFTSRWTALLEGQKLIDQIRSRMNSPKAVPTQTIFGPDTTLRCGPLGVAATAALGAFLGLFIAMASAIAGHVARRYL